MVLTEGPLSRVDLARRLGISSAAVTKAARPFLDDGYLHELDSERTAPGAGRPVSPLAITPDREFVAGAKVTADEVIGVVCDLTAHIRASARRPLPDCEPGTVVTALTALVGELLDELCDADPEARGKTRLLGVAVSGDLDPAAGRVRLSPLLGWENVDLAGPVSDATGLAVVVQNDVKALTVAEHWFGDGVGTDDFTLVTVGAGIGCGIVTGGRLLSGAFGVAGEVGHVCVDSSGPVCHCGARGCVEAIAATEAIVSRARQLTGLGGLTFTEAAELARSGSAEVRALFSEAGTAIGLGIAAVVNLVGPERIVVSGEGLDAYDLFETEIREAYAAHAFGAAARCPLIIRPLPFEQWARGAAAVGIQSLFTPARR
jgi:predicted NBD/HSP70 family sugar kinase